jgi:polysaccharide deacetylase family protein (PEP-CTERM system associated)
VLVRDPHVAGSERISGPAGTATAVDTRPGVAMSVDVEEWFQVENLRRAIPRGSWDQREPRVERAMDRMLELMSAANVRATCFVLGWVAERSPRLVERIAEAGHEIASHGYGHRLLPELDPGAFRSDVERSKLLLEDLSGEEVVGYRAPSFSLTTWARPILRELGFRYDSSYFPITLDHDRYGRLDGEAGRGGPVAQHDGITEVSLSCLRVGSHALPWAGGGWFRLVPYPVFRLGVRRILGTGVPYVFYIHPWELDAEQPRVSGLSRTEKLRHYLNLERTEARWTALLRDFAWMPLRELVAHEERRAQRAAVPDTARVAVTSA